MQHLNQRVNSAASLQQYSDGTAYLNLQQKSVLARIRKESDENANLIPNITNHRDVRPYVDDNLPNRCFGHLKSRCLKERRRKETYFLISHSSA